MSISERLEMECEYSQTEQCRTHWDVAFTHNCIHRRRENMLEDLSLDHLQTVNHL